MGIALRKQPFAGQEELLVKRGTKERVSEVESEDSFASDVDTREVSSQCGLLAPCQRAEVEAEQKGSDTGFQTESLACPVACSSDGSLNSSTPCSPAPGDSELTAESPPSVPPCPVRSCGDVVRLLRGCIAELHAASALAPATQLTTSREVTKPLIETADACVQVSPLQTDAQTEPICPLTPKRFTVPTEFKDLIADYVVTDTARRDDPLTPVSAHKTDLCSRSRPATPTVPCSRSRPTTPNTPFSVTRPTTPAEDTSHCVKGTPTPIASPTLNLMENIDWVEQEHHRFPIEKRPGLILVAPTAILPLHPITDKVTEPEDGTAAQTVPILQTNDALRERSHQAENGRLLVANGETMVEKAATDTAERQQHASESRSQPTLKTRPNVPVDNSRKPKYPQREGRQGLRKPNRPSWYESLLDGGELELATGDFTISIAVQDLLLDEDNTCTTNVDSSAKLLYDADLPLADGRGIDGIDIILD